ncbi:mechanosensitive ion channel family protein [Niabella yanshanensis]|uniref:Mechanosensitive ion channel family protein n=1 Tax=Niabella yanshanensis TaxID=577386 RepID=A0ABZ0W8E9_9BACT|nr:mechanosensitive ion channel family protein [Niabella yanshanensis]WQD38400.1 mechanosensitive ion channel family protein [Niabella yanshanensis]
MAEIKTEEWLDKLSTWVVGKGPAIVLAVLVLLIGLWLIKVFSNYLGRVMQGKKIDRSLKPFLRSLIIVFLRVLLLLAVMQIAGIAMTLFAALITSLGVAAGLALSGTLQNFASGILILFLKPFRVGDNILTQGQEGTVAEIRIFYTIITTYDNRMVVVPNSKLSNEVIINLSGSGNRRLDIEMKFGNAIDYEQVKSVIDQAIADAGNILEDPPRRVGISSLEADGYKVMLNLWIDAHGFVDTKIRFQEMLLQRLKSSGLKLPGMA